MSEPFRETLSAQGERRRAAMLDDLLGEMRTLHRRRRQRRRVLIGMVPALLACIIIAAWLATGGHSAHPHQSRLANIPQPPSPPIANHAVIVRVQTDPTLLERYRVTAVNTDAIRLNDDGLLAALAEMNRPAGLIRSEGRTWLTRQVATKIEWPDGSS